MIIEQAIDRMKHQRQPHYQPAVAIQRYEPPATRPVDLTFPRVQYDVRSCEENRILVPECEDSGTTVGVSAYRILRTRVLHLMRTNRWSTLALTSPGPGEGKSMTGLNLALSLAREKNHNVFLLDLDMSNPSVCPYLGVNPPGQIVRYFAGAIEPKEIFFSIGIPRLAIAGGVEATPLSSELLASTRLDDLLKYISAIAPNSMTILDLPPVLSTDDFLMAAPRADATLLVIAEGRSRRDGVERAMEVLSGFPLAGVMLNRSHERVTDYYSRRYYYGSTAGAKGKRDK